MKFNEYRLSDIKLFHSSVSAGRREYREHHHTECEISILLGGRGIYSVGSRNYSFQQDDIFVFGSDEIHCITEILPGADFELLNIQFEPKLLWEGDDRSALPLLKVFNSRSSAFSNRIDRDNPATAKIRGLILDMENEFCTQSLGYALKLKLNLFSILLYLLRDFGYVDNDKADTANEQVLSQLSAAMKYIDSHLNEPLTLNGIARHAAMGKSYFSTVFKKYNGISPWDYITIKRVKKAITLLEKTDLTKLEIAARCGFNSSANFYKAFSRITGKTPGYYSAK